MSRASQDPERRVLARGTVLVDPRAAVAKLREFQLPDPALYVLELARVAVASGATAIDVFNDADELRMTWDGDPLPAEELQRVLDHLFSTSERRLRLLAIAVNTALGLEPRSVDLYTTRHAGPAGTVARVRWTSRFVQGRDAADAESVQLEHLPPEPAMPEKGTRVYVVERFGSAVFWEFFSAEPVETQRLRAHAVALPVPLVLNGRRFEPTPPPEAVLTVPLAKGPLRGALALLPAGSKASNKLQLCERGILLEQRALFPEDGPQVPPLWLRVDTDELPTNASRDAVDLSGPFGRELERRTHEALEELLRAALAKLDAPDAEPLRALLRTLLWARFGADWVGSGRGLPAPWNRLLAAPLLPLATGGFAPVSRLREHDAKRPLPVWSGARPLDPSLAPLLGFVLWLAPGDTALGALVGAFSVEDVGLRLAAVEAARERQRAFLSRKPQPVRLGLYPRHTLASLLFGTGDSVAPQRELPEGAEGELCLRLSEAPVGQLRLTTFVEQRPLSTESWPLPLLKVDVVLTARGLRPRDDYEGTAHDRAFDQCIAQLHKLLQEVLTVLCATVASPESASVEDPRIAWVRPEAGALAATERGRLYRALCVLLTRDKATGPRRNILRELLERHPSLAELPAWPSATHADSSWTTAALRAHAQRERPVVYFTLEPTTVRRKDGLPLLLLADLDELGALDSQLPSQRVLCNFQPWLQGASGESFEARERRFAAESSCALRLSLEDARLLLAPSLEEREPEALHFNVPLRVPRPTPGVHGLNALLEDPGATPSSASATHSLTALSPPALRLLRQGPWDFVLAACELLEGAQEPTLRFWQRPTELGPALLRCLVSASLTLSELPEDSSVGLTAPTRVRELRARLERLPLVPQLDGSSRPARASLAALRERGRSGAGLPFLREPPTDVELSEWRPLLLTHPSLELPLSRALGVPLRNAEPELPERKRNFRRDRALASLRERPAVPPNALRELGVERVVVAEVAELGSCQFGVRPAGRAVVQLLVEGRVAVREHHLTGSEGALPIAAMVSFVHAERCFDESFQTLTEEGHAALARLLGRGLQLLTDSLGDRSEGAEPATLSELLLLAWRVERLGEKRKGQRALERYAAAWLWPTAQGKTSSALRLATPEGVRFCTRSFAPWIPPAAGEAEVPDAAVLPEGHGLVGCLQDLGGARSLDVTEALSAVQEQRRLRADPGRVARVRLASPPREPALRARLEELDPTAGVGELELLLDAPARTARVQLFSRGQPVGSCECASALPLQLAVESVPLAAERGLDEARVRPFVAGLGSACAKLLERALAGTTSPPASWRPLLRWYALAAPVPHAPVPSLPLFADSLGVPLTREQLDGQVRSFGSAGWVRPPPEPCDVGVIGRRAVVLEPEEVRDAHIALGLVCLDAHLERRLYALRWERQAPRADLAAELPAEARLAEARLTLEEDQYEGALALRVATELEGTVLWFKRRRPLGSTRIAASWPFVAAVELSELEPNENYSAPRDTGPRRAAEKMLRSRARRLLEERTAPPEDALVFARLGDQREGRKEPLPVQGSVHLPRSFEPSAGELVVLTPGGRRESWRMTAQGPALRSAHSQAPLPLCGTLWVHASVGHQPAQWQPLLDRVVRASYDALLRALLERSEESPQGDALDHVAYAVALGMAQSSELALLLHALKLPDPEVPLARLPRAAEGKERLPAPTKPARWYTALRALGMLAPPLEAARPEPTPPLAPAATTPAPAASNADPSGALLRRLLLRAGLPSRLLDQVVLMQGREEPAVQYVALHARALLAVENRTVRALLAAPRGHELVAMMVLGELNRALTALTDADEERIVEALLRDVVQRDEPSRG